MRNHDTETFEDTNFESHSVLPRLGPSMVDFDQRGYSEDKVNMLK